jgi:hypothetical protein
MNVHLKMKDKNVKQGILARGGRMSREGEGR